jgi:flagellar hook-associated protein 2
VKNNNLTGAFMSISIQDYYTSSTAGTLQYSGLTSETNWVDLVDDLMEIERYTINNLSDWKEEWAEKITSLQGLDSSLLILETIAGGINTAAEFYCRTSSSSDEDVLTVTNTSAAIPGAHSITVGSNIAHKLASQGWADQDTTAVGDKGGNFVISVGSQGTITISDADITGATTLEDLRDLINNDAENTGSKSVTASILNDGSGTNPYRLVITADNGGPSYEISITSNPTGLNFTGNEIGPADNSTLSGTATATSLGHYSGTISDSSQFATYTFTNSTGSDQTVGSGTWNLSWSRDKGGNSGTVSLGSDYTPGDTIEIEEGVFIQISAGTIKNGESFTVDVFNMDVDTAELCSGWGGDSDAVASGGNYLGSTSKTFTFSISGSGTKTIGTDSFDLTWTDSEGNSGTISVTDSDYTALEVFQGVTVSFNNTRTVEAGDTFSIDVFNSTLQAANSEGLAQVEVQTHSGFTDENTSCVTTVDGTFSYTYGGVTRSISVSADSTLAELRDLINNDDDNPGVTAAIIDDGSGLSTAFHLQLIGNDSGAAHAIEGVSHTLNNFSKGGTSGFGFTQTQNAQNAMIRVDGYPTDTSEYIQRDSNTIGNLINGLTMSLLGTGTSTISITNDTDAIKGEIAEFVQTINSVLDYIKEQTDYDEAGEGENNGVMIGNYAYQIISQRINDILSSAVPGLTDGVDTYTRLSQIGISTDPDQDGKWVIHSSTLSAALSNDIEAVCNLFTRNETTDVDGIAELVRDETDKLTKDYADANPGIVSVLINNYEEIIDNIDSKIEREERRLALVENRLNTKYTNLEVLLSELQNQSDYLTSMIEQLNKD